MAKGPAGGPPGTPPSGAAGGAALCCTCAFDATIATEGATDYFASAYDPGWSVVNAAKIEVTRTASGGEVKITKSFSLRYSAGATAAANKTAVEAAIKASMVAWTTAARGNTVRVEQPGCPPQNLKIKFVADIVASGADVDVDVDATNDPNLRSYVAGGTMMKFYTVPVSGTWVMTHEVGHTLGLPDEYTTVPGVPLSPAPPAGPLVTAPTASPTMTYKSTTPQQGAKSVVLTVNNGFLPGPTDPTYDFTFDTNSIMGQDGSNVYPIRVFMWIAIEVDKMLTAEGVPSVVKIV